ncbi:hypothetical protein NZ47_01420 [Anaerovibrio lipolyticus]|uniref:TPM domain-containing protein n=1 Tax=Anaerovibrio lipolyticus TaxID=82374 RepID=A0A0B2JZK5_9FIRM|nr:TPM domain-containing protein [Anaerovibrio lipolyticus]KHM52989.1 hypothetical protein NZ47_01420 [Anaerovibrio lipolyticus]
MKRIFTVFMSLLLLLAFTMPVMAETTKVKKVTNTVTQTAKQPESNSTLPNNLADFSIYDMADLIISDQEADKLLDKLNRIEQKHNVRVVVMTVTDLKGKDIKAFADDTLNKYYRDEAHNNGCIMMVVCPSVRKWAVTTDNNMRQRITDEKGYPAIRDSFMDNLKDNNYVGAFNDYADKVDELLNYYEKEGEPWDPANAFSIGGFVIALLLSVGIGYLFEEYLRGKMSNVSFVGEADEYLDRNSVNITEQSDTFLHTTRTVTKRSKSDDSSSSSGGSSSSNGGGSGSY